MGYSEDGGGRVLETGVTGEQGLGQGRVALVADTWTRNGAENRSRVGLALKLQAHHGPRWAVAVQGGALYADGSAADDAPPTARPCVGPGGEGRIAIGRGQARGDRGAFAALELAYRAQGGCAAALTEATIGYKLEAKWLLLAQAFQDHDLHGTETVKVQVSAVRFRRARGVQIGIRCRVDGAEAEPAVIIGVWRRDRRGH